MLFKSNIQDLGQKTEGKCDVGISICEIAGRAGKLGFGAEGSCRSDSQTVGLPSLSPGRRVGDGRTSWSLQVLGPEMLTQPSSLPSAQQAAAVFMTSLMLGNSARQGEDDLCHLISAS